MKRYQRLILNAVEQIGYTPLAREMCVPSTSVHEWATQPYKVPQYKSMEKLAAYFKVPLPSLLMEVQEERNYDDEIIEALFYLSEDHKSTVADLIHALRNPSW